MITGNPAPPDKARWRGASREERDVWRREMFIPHPKIREALDAMSDRIKLTGRTGASTGLFVYGETGSGKTRLASYMRDVVSAMPSEPTPDADHIPVIVVKCPEVSTRKQVALQVLAAMGAATPRSRNYSELIYQISKISRPTRLRVIIIDDVQDLLRGRSRNGARETAVALRDLLDLLSVTIVLLGTPESIQILQDNIQLRKRIPFRHQLPYFDMTGEQQMQQFKKLVHELEKWLPVADRSDLTSSEMLLRLARASNGIFQFLLDLLDRAVTEAMTDGVESIDKRHLARAFNWVFGGAYTKANPFLVDRKDLRSLDKPDEPFHEWA